MELWIRSQDKECLMKVDRVDYDLSSGVHQIKVNGYQTLVGKYKSKERALEVLDEISDLMRSIQYSELKTFIYEMPEQ